MWAGKSDDETFQERVSVVYLHVSGKWIRKETSGDTPKTFHWVNAHVLDDKMLVFLHENCSAEKCEDCNGSTIYCLDLFLWSWARLRPSGTPPLERSSGMKSWIDDGKIYFYGGDNISPFFNDGHRYPSYLTVTAGTSNQIVCHNVSENCWEWPIFGGAIPSPRFCSNLLISDDKVFLFGGYIETGEGALAYNDLYILDLNSSVWRKVHDNITNGLVPARGCSHVKFTKISQYRALFLDNNIDGQDSEYSRARL